MSDEQTAPTPRPLWVGLAAALVVVAVGLMLLIRGGSSGADRVADETVPAPTTEPSTTPPTTRPSTRPSTTRVVTPSTVATTSTVRPSGTVPLSTFDLDGEYQPIEVDEDDPAMTGRELPDEPPADQPPPTTLAPPPWAASTRITEGGHVSVDVGCADDRSLAAIDRFFAARVGPVLGWDYQHVYPLGGDRYLWLFQDSFIDHTGVVHTFDNARFVHNIALVQEGRCFRLLHRGSTARPEPFETGDGRSQTRTTWWWPMGGELVDGQIWVFWAEMLKDPYDPEPPDGLGWHPVRTYLASYDAATLERRSFSLAPNNGVAPIYGYAVSSDVSHTYLFGNTFEQNLVREGGFWTRGHSATKMWLARVPRGRLDTPPEYRTADGWSANPSDAVTISDRFYVENPMQPRFVDGQWVSATAVDGYWGDAIAVDVAEQPWGPWHTVRYDPLLPRGNDPKMNTYHAHVLPWRDGYGSVLISVSNNARNMRRDAWTNPHRYRPMFLHVPYTPTPTTTTTTPTTTTTTPPTTVPPTTTTSTSTSTTTTSTTTSVPSTTTTTSTTTTSVPTSSTTSSTSSTVSPTSSTSSTSTSIAQGQ